tara:strand:- start:801 stop:1223 length:423 start_codon:yes stop_codon:yes gene_type:complete
MKIDISVNFDFGKLSGKLDNIIEEYTSEFAKDSEKGSKAVIDSGKLPKLENSTKKWRKSKGYPTSPPLKATGKLYNSIKAEKNALKVIQYGKWHNDGEVPTTVARKFITTTPENKQRIDKKFMENVNKALRSKVRVASLG